MATSAKQLCEELPGDFAQYMQEVKDIPSGVHHTMSSFDISSENWL